MRRPPRHGDALRIAHCRPFADPWFGRRNMNARSLAALLAAMLAPLPAQDPCPDNTIKPIPTNVVSLASVPCGAGVKIDVGAAVYEVKEGLCPASIRIEPARDIPSHEPGCGTYAEVANQVDVVEIEFRCVKSYLIFIPLGSSCEVKDRHIVGQLANYHARNCRPITPTRVAV
jgi:hypothetical protein